MKNGTYYYGVSFYTNSYESNISYIPDINVVDNNQTTILSNIPISPDTNVIGRNIYRTQVNTTSYYLLDKIYDNTATQYIDDILDDELSNSGVPDTNFTQVLLINQNSDMQNGIYYYAVSYYTLTGESDITPCLSNAKITNSQSVQIINIPISSSNLVVGRRIYRTKANDMVFYLIHTIQDNVSSVYIDTKNDTALITSFVPQNTNICTKVPIIIRPSINNTYAIYSIIDTPVNLILNYNIISDIYIDIIQNTNYRLIPNFTYNNPFITYSGYNTSLDNFYYLCNKENIMDNIKLIVDPTSSQLVPATPVTDIHLYNLLCVSGSNIVPNLEKYISLSTDYTYLNDKKISDMNDMIFTKPFMMMMINIII